ncbi:hypothetical protein CLOM_g12164 [Closterium sp. NIES-68]|nr:hypothetical protein CLOM_g12164 [Closterium sp. NIES-68]GJP77319.1 hypothetical protein CLOP_g7731 [Closterium sp. NIES-67]
MVETEEASLVASFSNPYSACGFIGGIIFCVSILPQLVKTYRTKSAKDLSYFWQACYLLGLISISIYGVAYKLWPVAIPLIIEIVFMATLTVLKYRYDKRAKRKAAAGVEDGVDVTAADADADAEADGKTAADDADSDVDGVHKVGDTPGGVDEYLGGAVDGIVVNPADSTGALVHRGGHSSSGEPLDIVTVNELEMRRL